MIVLYYYLLRLYQLLNLKHRERQTGPIALVAGCFCRGFLVVYLKTALLEFLLHSAMVSHQMIRVILRSLKINTTLQITIQVSQR